VWVRVKLASNQGQQASGLAALFPVSVRAARSADRSERVMSAEIARLEEEFGELSAGTAVDVLETDRKGWSRPP
jgi:hypothetical protein